jgi:hypothetical protein
VQEELDSAEVARKFEAAIKAHTGTELREPSMVGDCADVYVRCASIRRTIERLVSEGEHTDSLSLRLWHLVAEIRSMGEAIQDFYGPLERAASMKQ